MEAYDKPEGAFELILYRLPGENEGEHRYFNPEMHKRIVEKFQNHFPYRTWANIVYKKNVGYPKNRSIRNETDFV